MSGLLTEYKMFIKVDYPLHNALDKLSQRDGGGAMDIIEYIKKTDAFDNMFFRHCKEWRAFDSGLVRMAPNWELVTRKFWLSTCSLAGVLACYCHTPPDLLIAILKIAAEDGGIGGGAVNGHIGPPHFNLYREMWGEGRVDWTRKVEPETQVLIDGFFSGEGVTKTLIESGLANVVIVETIASNIVEAMNHAHDSSAGFDPKKLDYLRLHKVLELEHAAAMPLVAILAKNHGMNLWPQFQSQCEAWGHFWRAMDCLVFGHG